MRNDKRKRYSEQKSSTLRMETLEPRQLLSVFGGMASHHDYGPNNNARLAETIDLDETGETTITGDISSARDKDYYMFTVENSGTITISMEALETDNYALDTFLTIYNSRKQKIAINDDVSTEDTNSYVEFYAQAGETYYIKADGYRKSTGDYEIILTTPTVSEAYGEEIDYANNVADSFDVNTIAEDDGTISIYGAIYPERDLDVFTFTVQADGNYAISMTSDGSTLDTYLYIYNEDGKLVYRNDDIEKANTDSYIEFYAEEGEVYYIRADAWKNSTGTYTLTVDNLSATDNTTIDTGDTTDSTVDASDDTGDTTSDSSTNDDSTSADDTTTDGSTTDDDADSNTETDASEGWVLIIGAYDYQGFQNDLTGPAYDTQLVSEIFTDYYSVSEDNIHILSGGSSVSYEAISVEFAWLAENADSNDYVVIYYSGHGSSGDSETVDDNESLYLPDSSSVYQSDIEGWLNTINTDTDKVLILDSCYSGGLLDIANNVSNTAVIASTSYNMTAWDAVESYYPQGNRFRGGGVFATWLNYGIMSGNADSDDNGYVTLLEAFNYADLGINNVTSEPYNQDPVINYSINFDLAIFLS